MLVRNPAGTGLEDAALNQRTTQQGFSLAEMTATLAIAAITASMAVPTMRSIATNGQRASDTNELIATFHAARSAAITNNVQVTICPSSDAEQCEQTPWQEGWIYFIDHNQDRQVDADDAVLGTANGMTDVTIHSPDFARFLAFRPNGQLMVNTTAENSGEMLLCDDRGSPFDRSLILHVGGKPQILTDPHPDAYAVCDDT